MPNASAWKGFVAGIALAAAVAASLGPCRPDETPTTSAPPRRDVATETRAERRRVRAAKPVAVKTTDAEIAAVAAPPDAPATATTDDEDFPGVDVEVVGFDGKPVEDATVYALPAGTEWTYDNPNPPSARVGDAGRCRLRVVRRGRYDVGAISGALQALATDVDVPRTDALRLALPEPAAVVVRFDPAIDAKRLPVIAVQTDFDADSRWPGRESRPSWSHQITARGTEWRFALPRGAPFTVTSAGGDSDGVRIEPARGVAPAEIRVSPDVRFFATLRFVFAPEGTSFPHPYVLHVDVAAGEGGNERTRSWDVGFDADAPAKSDALFPFLLPSDTGAIRWRGEGILPGSTTYSGLTRDVVNEIALRIRLAPDAPRPPPPDDVAPEDRPIRRTFRVAPAGAAGETEYAVLARRDGSVFSFEGFDTLSGTGAKWALVRRGDWTAAPIDVGPDEDGVVEFTLRRGGFLVVVPEGSPPPESLGRVTIARTDGLPMFVGKDADCAVRAEFAPGLVLGPLPAGDVAFVVRIGDEVVAEVAATVRAGGYEPLRIPKIRGR